MDDVLFTVPELVVTPEFLFPFLVMAAFGAFIYSRVKKRKNRNDGGGSWNPKEPGENFKDKN